MAGTTLYEEGRARGMAVKGREAWVQTWDEGLMSLSLTIPSHTYIARAVVLCVRGRVIAEGEHVR